MIILILLIIGFIIAFVVSYYNFIFPNEDEQYIIEALSKNKCQSMRVVGRGTLVVDAKEVIESESYRKLVAKADGLIKKSK